MKKKAVKFVMIDPDAKAGDYMSKEEDSPYVPLEKEAFHREIGFMQGPNDIVIAEPNIRVLIDYPLKVNVLVKMVADTPAGFTRRGLATKIARKYQGIYAREAASTKLPEETMHRRSRGKTALLNRAETDGKYGIWGHDLGDLLLHGVRYSPKRKVWVLDIDS